MAQEQNLAITLLPALVAGMSALAGVAIGQWYVRKTYVSNKIFEQRIDALNRIWAIFIELKIVVHKSFQTGYKRWREEHFAEAESLLNRFRVEIDKSQIILDYRIIEGFRKLDELYFLYAVGHLDDQERPSSFLEEFHAALEKLQSSINKVMNQRTQVIKLELRA
jgi:hypothetical protein